MKSKQVLFFDFFGTLVTYIAQHKDLDFSATLTFLSQTIPLTREAFLKSWRDCFTDARTSRAPHEEFTIFEVAQRFAARHQPALDIEQLISLYMADWCRGISPIPHLNPLLAGLSQDYRLAIISNTHYPAMVYERLELYGMRGYFEAVFTSAELGIKKPSAQIFQHALSHFSAPPTVGLHIGDSFEDDFCGAKNAQLESILITSSPHPEVPHQVSSILEVERFFR